MGGGGPRKLNIETNDIVFGGKKLKKRFYGNLVKVINDYVCVCFFFGQKSSKLSLKPK